MTAIKKAKLNLREENVMYCFPVVIQSGHLPVSDVMLN